MARKLVQLLGFFTAGHAIAAAFLGTIYPGATIIIPFILAAGMLWWGRPAKQREAQLKRLIKKHQENREN